MVYRTDEKNNGITRAHVFSSMHKRTDIWTQHQIDEAVFTYTSFWTGKWLGGERGRFLFLLKFSIVLLSTTWVARRP